MFRVHSQGEDEIKEQYPPPHEQYQDKLKSIVYSYINMANPKWDHANVNGTKHWDRRPSRIAPINSSIPREGFGNT